MRVVKERKLTNPLRKLKDHKNPFNEAFRSGYADTAVPKIARIISRRTGEDFETNTEFPLMHKNSYGDFAGYMCMSANKAFRINFSLGDSDQIDSVDFFDTPGEVLEPDTFVEFESNDNIINIINTIEALVNGERLDLDESVKSRLSIRERRSAGIEVVHAWIEEDGRAKEDIQNRRLSQVFADYIEWAQQENRLQVSQPTFNKAVKQYLNDNGLSNKFLKAGSQRKSQRSNLVVDSKEEADFNQELEMSVEEQEEALDSQIDILSQGYYKAMLVTGRPGINKTNRILPKVKELPLQMDYISGGMSSAKDLYEYLYRHRENMVLILDDIDDVLLSKPTQRLLKSVLDMSFEREHTVNFFDKRFVDPEEMKNMTPKQKRKAVPNRFVFKSRVIFISNSPRSKFDPAILSRSLNLHIDVSNEEILKNIRSKIDEFYKTIDHDKKIEVLEFFEEHFDMFKAIDYRSYYKALVFRISSEKYWKKWTYADLAAS